MKNFTILFFVHSLLFFQAGCSTPNKSGFYFTYEELNLIVDKVIDFEQSDTEIINDSFKNKISFVFFEDTGYLDVYYRFMSSPIQDIYSVYRFQFKERLILESYKNNTEKNSLVYFEFLTKDFFVQNKVEKVELNHTEEQLKNYYQNYNR